jgi:hypothetical protein
MKKLVLVALLVFAFALSAMAQTSPIDKKSWFLGGNIYFQSEGGDLAKARYDDTRTTILIAPEFGYFISPGLQLGATVTYIQYKIDEYKETAMAFGPMVGYYFNMNKASTEIKGGLYPYIKGFFLIGSEKYGDGTDDSKYSGTNFGGKVGFNYMLSESVALDANIMFSSDSWKQKEPVETESESGSTMRIGVGATYFIWK